MSETREPAGDPTAGDPTPGASAAGEPGDGEPEQWRGERLRSYREALDTRRRRQVRAGQLFAAALAVIAGAGVVFRAPESWWVPAVGGCALLAVLFRLVNWKCPNCGERLASRRPGARCPGCGAPLD